MQCIVEEGVSGSRSQQHVERGEAAKAISAARHLENRSEREGAGPSGLTDLLRLRLVLLRPSCCW